VLFRSLLGENRDIFFPKLDEDQNLISFSQIAERYLRHLGFEPVSCDSEEEARLRVTELKQHQMWPVYFFKSDTTGEKDFEEFYTQGEHLDLKRFESIGIIKNEALYDELALQRFRMRIQELRAAGIWKRDEIIDLFNEILPEFRHKETGKFLDGRM
jgi:hypothetical protein